MKSKDSQPYDPRMGLSLYFSSGLLLFAGLILGAMLVPWSETGIPQYYVAFIGVGLFVGGFAIQRKREKSTEKEINQSFSKLEKRIEELEEKLKPKSENQ